MKFRYSIILFWLFAIVSCQKKLMVKDAPDFSVSIIDSSTTYKAGEPINFAFEGSADIISFYSGEALHDYASRDNRVVDVKGKGVTLSFNSGVAPGSPAGTQADQFSILVSSDFSGDFSDLAKVKAATWKNITDSFTLGTAAKLTPAGEANISNLVVEGKPLYIALRYINRPQVANGFAQQWFTENLALKSIDAQLNGEPVTITDQVHAGFRIVDQYPEKAPARSQVTTTRVTLYGPIYKDPKDPIYDPNNPIFDPNNPIYNPDSSQYNPAAELPVFVPYDSTSIDTIYNDPASENWAVSAPITLDQVDLGGDNAVSVRGITNGKRTSYSYTYATPGTYKAVFVASNNTIDERKEVVKEITITITP